MPLPESFPPTTLPHSQSISAPHILPPPSEFSLHPHLPPIRAPSGSSATPHPKSLPASSAPPRISPDTKSPRAVPALPSSPPPDSFPEIVSESLHPPESHAPNHAPAHFVPPH